LREYIDFLGKRSTWKGSNRYLITVLKPVGREKTTLLEILSPVRLDPSTLDFRRQEDFFHDVNSVASVLKQFFRDLPEPLFTNILYQDFIDASSRDVLISYSIFG
jgi:hypothetical protein